jgi:predicted amidophosphoribosyltransferase
MQKIKYRLNYLLRRIALGLGLCPRCWQRVNYTTTGRPICPNCGK